MGFAVVSDLELLRPTTGRNRARQALAEVAGRDFERDRAEILRLIDRHRDIAMRTCRPGHLTGSAFVVDPSRMQGLVLFHTKLQRWLQPGGHADGDTNLAGVALKEATEETGIEGLRVVTPAIDVDIHTVNPPHEDAHLHLDVRFLVLAPAGVEPVGNHESQGFRWVGVDDMTTGDFDEATVRMARLALAVAADLGR